MLGEPLPSLQCPPFPRSGLCVLSRVESIPFSFAEPAKEGPMSGRSISTLLSAVAAAALMNIAGAQAQNAPAISGVVNSAQEGNMEGVIVTAKKDGAHISVSVVSDDKGRYAFPANRLEPGHYSIKIRAIGYIANGRPAVDVVAGKTASLDLK